MTDRVQVSGVVQAKTGNGKSIKVNGDFYGAYRTTELDGINKGDNVSFEYEFSKCGKWRNIKGDITVSAAAAPSQTAAPARSEAPARKNAPAEAGSISRDRTIVRQNATSNASRIVAALIAAGRFNVPGNQIGGAVIRLAVQFEQYCMADAAAPAAPAAPAPEAPKPQPVLETKAVDEDDDIPF